MLLRPALLLVVLTQTSVVHGERPVHGFYQVRPHRRFTSVLESWRRGPKGNELHRDAVEAADAQEEQELEKEEKEKKVKEDSEDARALAEQAEEEAQRKEKEAAEARKKAEEKKKRLENTEKPTEGHEKGVTGLDGTAPNVVEVPAETKEEDEDGAGMEYPKPGSEKWKDCKSHGAHRCVDMKDHCCCNVGSKFEESRQTCLPSELGDEDPEVKRLQIQGSRGSKQKMKFGLCSETRGMHDCGTGCCCSGLLEWDVDAQICQAPPSERGPGPTDVEMVDPSPPKEDPIPGSQTWRYSGYTCEAKEAYGCGPGRSHCCCRFGCEFIEIWDKCGHCKDDAAKVKQNMIPASHLWEMRVKRGICNAKYSHPCGVGCCCNAGWAWSKEQRRCLLQGGAIPPQEVSLPDAPVDAPAPPGQKPEDGAASVAGFGGLLLVLVRASFL